MRCTRRCSWRSDARRRILGAIIAATIPAGAETLHAQPGPPCRGDCNANGQVSVNELITAVGITLGNQPVTACVPIDDDEDGAVAINEIIQAVGSSLDGCSAPDSLYGPVAKHCAGSFPIWVATSEISGDGALDVVVVNRDSDDLSILLGDGDGGFASHQRIAVAGEPRAAAARDADGDGVVELPDIDGDGHADIVTANRESRSVAILRGLGDGTFATPEVIELVESRPHAVSVADLDGDDEIDMLVVSASPDQGNLRFLPSFANEVAFDVGAEPRDAAVADFDADGMLDAVVSNRDSDDVSVFFGGEAGLEAGGEVAVGERPLRLAIGDLDGDGPIDIVTVNQASDRLAVLRSDGERGFAPVERYPVGNNPQAAEIGDVDGDRRTDVVVANRGDHSVSILLGTASGLLRLRETIALPSSDCDAGVLNDAQPIGVAIGDLDGDGGLDLIVANSGSGSISVLLRR